ncbi:MAG: hypothetical protein LBI67_07625 [Treponema sp.]|nr:hypothetical protein [Treponema sp.]
MRGRRGGAYRRRAFSRRALFFLVFGLFRVISLGAEYFYPDGEEVEIIGHISRRMGRALPFSAFPVHGGDILAFAEKLAADPGFSRLNSADTALLEALISRLEEQRDGDILLKGNLELAYEQRLTTNSFTIDDTSKMANAEDFRRAFLDFSPVVSFGAAGGTFTGPWIAAQVDLRPAWTNDYSPYSNFFTAVDITYDILKRGVFAWNGTYVNFFAGRDTIHWGNPRGSTLYPSKLLPYMDSIRLNVPLGPFSFDYMLGTIIPKKAGHDVYDVDTPSPPYTDYFGFLNEEKPSTILVAGHRFQWNFGSLKAGIGGTVIYVRANNAFHVTDVLPVMVYHNADITPNNLNMVLDFSWAIAPGLSVSATAGFDDISARTFGIPDGDIPTIPGGIVQADYSAALESVFMDFHLEGGYTHYLWGNFHYDDPPFSQAEARLAKAIYRYGPNHDAVLLPLTSPYGPGVIWGKLNANFAFPERHIKAGAEFLLLTKKRDVNLVDTKYSVDDTTKDSPRIWYGSFQFPFSYSWKNLEFSACPGILFGSSDFAVECTLGLRWRLAGRTWMQGPY